MGVLHMRAKIGLALLLALSGGLVSSPALSAVRQYFVAAAEGMWDFAPSGRNLVHCLEGPPPCDIPEPWTNSHTFPVTRYIQYTDISMRNRVPQPVWLGILGPIIRAEVGDTVRVHFCNRARIP